MKYKLVTISLITICIALIIYGGFNYLNNNQESEAASNTALGMPGISDVESQRLFETWAKPGLLYCQTAEQASNELLFALKVLPNNSEYPNKVIYVRPSSKPEDRSALIMFGEKITDVSMSVSQAVEDPDFYDLSAQMSDDIDKGICHSDKKPAVKDIDGTIFWTIEPGYNVLGESKYARPGVVEWYDNGVLYVLYGTKGPNGTSLDKLLAIALATKKIDVDPDKHASREDLKSKI